MPNKSNTVHRLIDMVVEEVSLVDHAANKHRFLIVKRSDPMDENNLDTSENQEENPNELEDPVDLNELPEEEDDNEHQAESFGNPTSEQKNRNTVELQISMEALEALTNAIEALGELRGEEAHDQVLELAHTLHGFAERLEGGASENKNASAPPAFSEGARIDAVLASVRSMLERVGRRIEDLESTAQKPDEQAENKNTQSIPSETQTGITRKLDELVSQSQAIGKTVQAQQERLARMEKRFGLPNSTPIETSQKSSKSEDVEDVGWPLDLNRSFDRESVDKAVSFHDL